MIGRRWGFPAIICCVGIIQLFFILSLHRDWWFEDDPNIVAFVRHKNNPADYFFDRELIRQISAGRVLTPMQTLSFWLDDLIAPFSPLAAYLHTALSALITAFLLYWVCVRRLSRGAALGVALLWFFLPSTVSVLEFISARQYLEGLAWMLLSLLCAFRAVDGGRNENRRRWIFFAVGAYLLASLSKELYVTTGAWLLVLVFFEGRRSLEGLAPRAIGWTVAAVLIYAGYRVWTIGLIGDGFGASQPFWRQYPLFLERYPFIFTGNQMGYLLFGMVFLVAIFLVFKKKITLFHCFFFGSNLFGMLLTVYPVTKHLFYAYQDLGTWYRVAFLLNLFILYVGFWIVDRLERTWPGRLVFPLAAAAVIYGAWTAAANWDASKELYRADGRFYLDHPGRLLYSELPGTMFLSGIHNLYTPGRPKHYISAKKVEGHMPRCLDSYYHIWRRTAVGYRPDPSLYSLIPANIARNKLPLHGAVPEGELSQYRRPEQSAFSYQDGSIHVVVPRSNGTDRYDLPIPETSGRVLHFLFPPIEDDVRVHVWLINDGPEEIEGFMEGFSQAGEIIATRAFLIPRNGASQISRADFFSNDWEKGVRITATSNNILKGCLFYEQGARQSAMIPPLARGPLAGSNGTGLGTRIYVTHVPANRRDWQTYFLVTNPSSEAREISFRLFSEKGRPIIYVEHIEPGQTLRFETDRFEDRWGQLIQSAVISFDRGGPLLMTVCEYQNRWMGLVPQKQPETAFVLSQSGEDDYLWEGLALFNPGDLTASVRFLDEFGRTVDRIDLAPGKKHIQMTDPLFESGIRFISSDHPISGLIFRESRWGNLETFELETGSPSGPAKTEERR